MVATTSLRFGDHETFARIAAELYRRGGYGKTEAGCFLLGQINGTDRVVEDIVYFDDVDPNAYRYAAIRFDTTKLSAVYDICEAKSLSIVGDMHTHPFEAFLSPIDRAYPVMALAGHVSIILPYDGRYRTARQVAVNVYQRDGNWAALPQGECASYLGIDKSKPEKDGFDRVELMLLRKGLVGNSRGTLLRGIQVGVVVDRETCQSVAGQAAVLTTVALCSRFARGGVAVRLSSDLPVHAIPNTRLSDEVRRLGGEPWTSQPENIIALGADAVQGGSFTVYPWSRDGVYGCGSHPSGRAIDDTYVPGVIAAVALAVGEIFRYRVLRKVEVAPRDCSIRLWSGSEHAALSRDVGSTIKDLWLLGFGHLGNAYAWVIAHTPSLRPKLFVQDPQSIDVANASTQLFAVPADVGTEKVQVAKRELARYGVKVDPHVREINDRYVPAWHPAVVLGGLDNVAPRRALSNAKVSLIIDAGLGRTETTFSQFRINTISDPPLVLDLFEESDERDDLDSLIATPSFAEMNDGSPDAVCGLLALADTAVAVPFVGTVVAAVVITQLLRCSESLKIESLISGDVLAGMLPTG